MSKICQLDKSYDLWLSYSWSSNNHGICGHTFEVLDYYYILKNHFKVGILLAEDIDWGMLYNAIISKYDFTPEEIQSIKDNVVFYNRPKLLVGSNILFTDGGVKSLKDYTLLFDNIIHFACGDMEIEYSKDHVLLDKRVYSFNGIDYKKRILFDRLLTVNKHKDNTLVYATKNCRDLSADYYKTLSKTYNNLLVITNEENKPAGINYIIPPVKNLFEQFSTFVYTPVERHLDCSPRFITECKYYNKDVIYDNIDYWEEDKGLYWRKWDIDNDFESLYLKEDDDIIDIIKSII